MGKENKKGMENQALCKHAQQEVGQVPLGRKAEKGWQLACGSANSSVPGHMKKILEENKENLKGMENQQGVDALPDPSFIMVGPRSPCALLFRQLPMRKAPKLEWQASILRREVRALRRRCRMRR